MEKSFGQMSKFACFFRLLPKIIQLVLSYLRSLRPHKQFRSLFFENSRGNKKFYRILTKGFVACLMKTTIHVSRGNSRWKTFDQNSENQLSWTTSEHNFTGAAISAFYVPGRTFCSFFFEKLWNFYRFCWTLTSRFLHCLLKYKTTCHEEKMLQFVFQSFKKQYFLLDGKQNFPTDMSIF